MRIEPVCVPCLLKRIVYEAELVDPSKAPDALRVALKIFAEEYTGREVSAVLATKVHRAAYDAIGVRDPYAEVKEESNRIAAGLIPRAREYIENAGDKLRAAFLVAITGNIMDFGIGTRFEGPEALAQEFENLLGDGIGHDDTDKVVPFIKKGADILLFTDNCGEVLFDGLLGEVIRGTGAKVTMVVKGEPILTDATREDVDKYGIDKQVDEVLDTGSFGVGIEFDKIPSSLKARMERCDLIVSKGMANFESFSDSPYHPIVHLMRSKCGPVARALGLKEDINVVKFYP
jgi:uncharacterized protein with ATP-grasp and redox domains